MRCAVVDLSTQIVVNIIVADAATDHGIDGCKLVNLEDAASCDIGWLYDPAATPAFIDPAPPTPDEATA